ncbi:MAG: MbnP family protein [Flavobacteriales bacterium]|jgi:hypothetical protein
MKHFFILLSLFAFASCKKEKITPPPVLEETIELKVFPVFGGSTLYLDSIYTGPNGERIKVTDIAFYLTKLQSNGLPLSEVAYFDYRNIGNALLSLTKKHTDFPSLSGVIGVDTSLNHDDPSAFPNESPLNIANAGPMHWGWNTGYIFISIEGKADTLVDGTDNLDVSFSYHIGTDAMLQPFSFPQINWVQTGEKKYAFHLNFDLFTFFFNPLQPVTIATEPFTHSGAGSQALTQKIAENFKEALFPQ